MPSPVPLDSSSKPTDPNLPITAKRKLLIVDDEEGPRQSLYVVFQDDYEVHLADDGRKAIELAKMHQVDAAILDIRMSGMSGIELLKHLKSVNPAIEVVMLTAYETPETTRQALRLGACDYLNKPFDIPAMREAVAKAMQRRSYTEQIHANEEKLEQLKTEVRLQKMELETGRTRVEIYASILHDISSPLTVISTATGMVLDLIEQCVDLNGKDKEDLLQNLEAVQRNASNCSNIALRYLAFLRKRAPGEAVVSLKPILDDLPHLLTAQPGLDQRQLTIAPTPADVRVKIEGTDLFQILINLVKNALQCTTQPHRVEIQSRLLHVPVPATDLIEGPHDRVINRDGFTNTPPLLVLSVVDNGPGIPSDILPKLFSPFFSTKAEGQGVGLGLAIVQRLITEAHGALHIHSVPGQGTSFTIYLGVAPPIT